MSDKSDRIPLIPTAWALSAALVATFIACAGFELIAPNIPVAHGWVGLFTLRPVTSGLGWVEGIAGSVAFGWFFAAIGTWVFNALARR
ncbi:MAG: hypothetical protein R3D30_06520 [Hyphomicrobiales bacterium]